MSRRRKIIIVLSCSLLVIAVVFFFRHDSEPSYQGRSLSSWVVANAFRPGTDAGPALREIGTNAIPYLLQWIQFEPSPTKAALISGLNRPVQWLNNKLPTRSDWSIPDLDKQITDAAPSAFRFLGPHANMVIPTLTRLLNDADHLWASHNAAEALSHLGQPGLGPLMAAFDGTNADARQFVIQNIYNLGTNARPFVPHLIQILADDTGDSGLAANALGMLKAEQDIVIPLLIKSLSATNHSTRIYATIALGQYGPLARPAIPSLTRLATTDTNLHNWAAGALDRIDPKAYTNGITNPVSPH